MEAVKELSTNSDTVLKMCGQMNVTLNIHHNILPPEEYLTYKNHLVEYEQCALQGLFDDEQWLAEQKGGKWKEIDTRHGVNTVTGKLAELYLSCAINKAQDYTYVSDNSKIPQMNNIDGWISKKQWTTRHFSVQVKTGRIFERGRVYVKRKWFNEDMSNATDRVGIVDMFSNPDRPVVLTISGDLVVKPFMKKMDEKNVERDMLYLPSDNRKVQWWELQYL